MAGSLKISVLQLETGTYAPGSVNTEPTILAVAGLTSGGSGSQSTQATPVPVVGSKSHHHE